MRLALVAGCTLLWRLCGAEVVDAAGTCPGTGPASELADEQDVAFIQVQFVRKHEEERKRFRRGAVGAEQHCRPGDTSTLLYIGVFTAPKNHQRRSAVRQQWLHALHSDPEYAGCVTSEFVVGHEFLKDVTATSEQQKVEKELQAEKEAYGDVFRLGFPEDYNSLPDKTLYLLRRGVEKNASFILKVDDDRLVNISDVLRKVRSWDAKEFIYAGSLWDKPAYSSQRGADSKFVKYMGGPSYIVSGSLAKRIAQADAQHSAEYLLYGTFAEDLDMGRWVQYASRNATVQFVDDQLSCPLVGFENGGHE